MAKPDDRSDNAEKIRNAMENTQENLQEGEEMLNEFGEEMNPADAEALREKNERRRESFDNMRGEIRDES